MAEQKIKFKVSIKELSFEYEGSREVGQALQTGLNQSLARLMDTQRTVMALPNGTTPPATEIVDGDGAAAPPAAPTPAAPAEKVKKPRRTNGVSLINILRELKQERYFNEPRSAESIREKVRLKGHTFSASTVAARLQDLTKKKELHRAESEEGFVYKDTPFNESPGAPSPPVEPAE
jgi:hypothetical protein